MNAGRVSSSHLNLLATRTALPALRHEGSAVEEAFAGWLSSQSRAVQVKGQRILRNAGVEARRLYGSVREAPPWGRGVVELPPEFGVGEAADDGGGDIE